MRPARIEEDQIPLGVRVADPPFAEQFVPGVALGLDLRAHGRNVVCILEARARLFLTESGFPRGLVSDSNSMLGREAGMDDKTLFGRSPGAGAEAR
jgi:hypothetical protein